MRFTSAGRGQIQGGLFAFPVAVVMGVAALLSERLRSAWTRALVAAVVALNAVDLVLTYERTFWIATLVALAVVAVRATRPQRLRAVTLAAALIAVVLAGMAVAAPRDLTAARERLLSIGNYGTDLSVRYRLTESRHVIDEIRAQPLVGLGPGRHHPLGTGLRGRAPRRRSPSLTTATCGWPGSSALPAAGLLVLLIARSGALAPPARADHAGGDRAAAPRRRWCCCCSRASPSPPSRRSASRQ